MRRYNCYLMIPEYYSSYDQSDQLDPKTHQLQKVISRVLIRTVSRGHMDVSNEQSRTIFKLNSKFLDTKG